MMDVYRPVRWKCPKCGMHSHTAYYIQHDDTIRVECTHCHYWVSCLPKDRVVQ
jgi:ribosomal protein S27AE